MADVFEILYALLEYNNWTIDELEKIRINKKEKKGAFKEKLFLIEVENN